MPVRATYDDAQCVAPLPPADLTPSAACVVRGAIIAFLAESHDDVLTAYLARPDDSPDAIAQAVLAALHGAAQRWSRYCGLIHVGNGLCPRIRAIEYHDNGQVKRVEFHTTAPVVVSPPMLLWPPIRIDCMQDFRS